jgi:hypothetical protein
MHRNWTGRSSDRGSRRKILHEDGQLAMIVQWDAGYRMSGVEHQGGGAIRATAHVGDHRIAA